ncbi:MAG: ABC transporter permease [Planctomycetota bacterium]|nr:ABC transporter permease [Planctomycetota bacterium]
MIHFRPTHASLNKRDNVLATRYLSLGFAFLGRNVISFLSETGSSLETLGRSVRSIVTLRCKWRRSMDQIVHIGVGSIPIVTIATFFVGMVMAVHVSTALAQFGVSLTVASIVCASILRELAPIFAALLIAGRAGAGITAELGAMQISGQLLAMRSLSLSVEDELIAPRFLATILSLVSITLLAGISGILGGYIVGIGHLDIPFATYHGKTLDSLDSLDLYCGLFKSVFFGLVIAIVGCHYGLSARGGASQLGINTKRSVVTASFVILVSNFFLTKAFIHLFE